MRAREREKEKRKVDGKIEQKKVSKMAESIHVCSFGLILIQCATI